MKKNDNQNKEAVRIFIGLFLSKVIVRNLYFSRYPRICFLLFIRYFNNYFC